MAQMGFQLPPGLRPGQVFDRVKQLGKGDLKGPRVDDIKTVDLSTVPTAVHSRPSSPLGVTELFVPAVQYRHAEPKRPVIVERSEYIASKKDSVTTVELLSGRVEATSGSFRREAFNLNTAEAFSEAQEVWAQIQEKADAISEALGGRRVVVIPTEDGGFQYSLDGKNGLDDVHAFHDAISKAAQGQGGVLSVDGRVLYGSLLSGLTEEQLEEAKANLETTLKALKAEAEGFERLKKENPSLEGITTEELNASLNHTASQPPLSELGATFQVEIYEDKSLNLFVNSKPIDAYIQDVEEMVEEFEVGFQKQVEVTYVEAEKVEKGGDKSKQISYTDALAGSIAEQLDGDVDYEDVLNAAADHMRENRVEYTAQMQEEIIFLILGGFSQYDQFGHDVEKHIVGFVDRLNKQGITQEDVNTIETDIREWVEGNFDELVDAFIDSDFLRYVVLDALAESSNVKIREFNRDKKVKDNVYGTQGPELVVYFNPETGDITPAEMTTTYATTSRDSFSDPVCRAVMQVKAKHNEDVIKGAELALSDNEEVLEETDAEAIQKFRVEPLKTALVESGTVVLVGLPMGAYALIKDDGEGTIAGYVEALAKLKKNPSVKQAQVVDSLEKKMLQNELGALLNNSKAPIHGAERDTYTDLLGKLNAATSYLPPVSAVGAVTLEDITVVVDTKSAHLFRERTAASEESLKKNKAITDELQRAEQLGIRFGEQDLGSGKVIDEANVTLSVELGALDFQRLKLSEIRATFAALNAELDAIKADVVHDKAELRKEFRREDRQLKRSHKALSAERKAEREAELKELEEPIEDFESGKVFRELQMALNNYNQLKKALVKVVEAVSLPKEFIVDTSDLDAVKDALWQEALELPIAAMQSNKEAAQAALDARLDVTDAAIIKMGFKSLGNAKIFKHALTSQDQLKLSRLHQELLALQVISRAEDAQGRTFYVVTSPLDPNEGTLRDELLKQLENPRGVGLTRAQAEKTLAFLSSKHQLNVDTGYGHLHMAFPSNKQRVLRRLFEGGKLKNGERYPGVETRLEAEGLIKVNGRGKDRKIVVLKDPSDFDVEGKLDEILSEMTTPNGVKFSDGEVEKTIEYLQAQFQAQNTRNGFFALSKLREFEAEYGCSIVLNEVREKPVFDIRHPFLPVEDVIPAYVLETVQSHLEAAGKAAGHSVFLRQNVMGMFRIPNKIKPPHAEVIKVTSLTPKVEAELVKAARLNQAAIIVENEEDGSVKLVIPGNKELLPEEDSGKTWTSKDDAIYHLMSRTRSVLVSSHQDDGSYTTDQYEYGWYGVRVKQHDVDLTTIEGVSPLTPPSTLQTVLAVAGVVGLGLLVGGASGLMTVRRQGTLEENYSKYEEWRDAPDEDKADIYVDPGTGARFYKETGSSPTPTMQTWNNFVDFSKGAASVVGQGFESSLGTLYTASSIATIAAGYSRGNKWLMAAGALGLAHSMGIPGGASAHSLRGGDTAHTGVQAWGPTNTTMPATRQLSVNTDRSIHQFVVDAGIKGSSSDVTTEVVASLEHFYTALSDMYGARANSSYTLPVLPSYDSGTATVEETYEYLDTLHETVLEAWQQSMSTDERSDVVADVYQLTGGRFRNGLEIDPDLMASNVATVTDSCVFPVPASINVTEAISIAQIASGYAPSQFSNVTGPYGLIDGYITTLTDGSGLFSPDGETFELNGAVFPICVDISTRPVDDDEAGGGDDGGSGDDGSGGDTEITNILNPQSYMSSVGTEWGSRVGYDGTETTAGAAMTRHLETEGAHLNTNAERLDVLNPKVEGLFGFNLTTVNASTFAGISADEVATAVKTADLIDYALTHHSEVMEKQMPALKLPNFSSVGESIVVTPVNATAGSNTTMSVVEQSVLAKMEAVRDWCSDTMTVKGFALAEDAIRSHHYVKNFTDTYLPGSGLLFNASSDINYDAAGYRVSYVLEVKALLSANPLLLSHVTDADLKADIETVFPRGVYTSVNTNGNEEALIRIADRLSTLRTADAAYQAHVQAQGVPLETVLQEYAGHLGVNASTVCPGCTDGDVEALSVARDNVANVRFLLQGVSEGDYDGERLPGAPAYSEVFAAKTHANVTSLKLGLARKSLDRLHVKVGLGADIANRIEALELSNPGFLGMFLELDQIVALNDVGISFATLGGNFTASPGGDVEVSEAFKSNYLYLLGQKDLLEATVAKVETLVEMRDAIAGLRVEGGVPDAESGVSEDAYSAWAEFYKAPNMFTAETALNYADEVTSYTDAAKAAMRSDIATLKSEVDALGTGLSRLNTTIATVDAEAALKTAIKEYSVVLGVEEDAVCPGCTVANYTSVLTAKEAFQPVKASSSYYTEADYNKYKYEWAPSYDDIQTASSHADVRGMNVTLAKLSFDRMDRLAHQGSTLATELFQFDAKHPGVLRSYLSSAAITALEATGTTLGENLGNSTVKAGVPGTEPSNVNTYFLEVESLRTEIESAQEYASYLARMLTVVPTLELSGGVPAARTGVSEDAYNKLNLYKSDPRGLDVTSLVDSYKDEVLLVESSAQAALVGRVYDHGERLTAAEYATGNATFTELVKDFGTLANTTSTSSFFSGVTPGDYVELHTYRELYRPLKNALVGISEAQYNESRAFGAPTYAQIQNPENYAALKGFNFEAGRVTIANLEGRVQAGRNIVDRLMLTDSKYTGMLRHVLTAEQLDKIEALGYTPGSFLGNGTFTSGTTSSEVPTTLRAQYLELRAMEVDFDAALENAETLGRMLVVYPTIVTDASGNPVAGSGITPEEYTALSTYESRPSSGAATDALAGSSRVLAFSSEAMADLRAAQLASNGTLADLQRTIRENQATATFDVTVDRFATLLNTTVEDGFVGITAANVSHLSRVFDDYRHLRASVELIGKEDFDANLVVGSSTYDQIVNAKTFGDVEALKFTASESTVTKVGLVESIGEREVILFRDVDDSYPGLLRLFLSGSSVVSDIEKTGYLAGTRGLNDSTTNGTMGAVPSGFEAYNRKIGSQFSALSSARSGAKLLGEMLKTHKTISLGADGKPADTTLSLNAYQEVQKFVDDPSRSASPSDLVALYAQEYADASSQGQVDVALGLEAAIVDIEQIQIDLGNSSYTSLMREFETSASVEDAETFFSGVTPADYVEVFEFRELYDRLKNGLNGVTRELYNASYVEGAPTYDQIQHPESYEALKEYNFEAGVKTIARVDVLVGPGQVLVEKLMRVDETYTGMLRHVLTAEQLAKVEAAGFTPGSFLGNGTYTMGTASSEAASTFREQLLELKGIASALEDAMENAETLGRMRVVLPTIVTDASGQLVAGSGITQKEYDALSTYEARPSSEAATLALGGSSRVLAFRDPAMTDLRTAQAMFNTTLAAAQREIRENKATASFDVTVARFADLMGTTVEEGFVGVTAANVSHVNAVFDAYSSLRERVSHFEETYALYRNQTAGAPSYAQIMNVKTFAQAEALDIASAQSAVSFITSQIAVGANALKAFQEVDGRYPGLMTLVLNGDPVLAEIELAGYKIGEFRALNDTTAGEMGVVPVGFEAHNLKIASSYDTLSAAREQAEFLGKMLETYATITVDASGKPVGTTLPKAAYEAVTNLITEPSRHSASDVVKTYYVDFQDAASPATQAQYADIVALYHKVEVVENATATLNYDGLVAQFMGVLDSTNTSVAFDGVTAADFDAVNGRFIDYTGVLGNLWGVDEQVYNASRVAGAPSYSDLLHQETYAGVVGLNLEAAAATIANANTNVQAGFDVLKSAIVFDQKYPGYLRATLTSDQLAAISATGYTLGILNGGNSTTAGKELAIPPADISVSYLNLKPFAGDIAGKLLEAAELSTAVTVFPTIETDASGIPLAKTRITEAEFTAVEDFITNPSRADVADLLTKTDSIVTYGTPSLRAMGEDIVTHSQIQDSLRASIGELRNTTAYTSMIESFADELGSDVETAFPGITEANFTVVAADYRQFSRVKTSLMGLSATEFDTYGLPGAPSYSSVMTASSYADVKALDLVAVQRSIRLITLKLGEAQRLINQARIVDAKYPGLLRLYVGSSVSADFESAGFKLGEYPGNGTLPSGGNFTGTPADYATSFLSLERQFDTIEGGFETVVRLGEMLKVHGTIVVNATTGAPVNTNLPKATYDAVEVLVSTPSPRVDAASLQTLVDSYEQDYKDAKSPALCGVYSGLEVVQRNITELADRADETHLTTLKHQYAVALGGDAETVCDGYGLTDYATMETAKEDIRIIKYVLRFYDSARYNAVKLDAAPTYEELHAARTHADVAVLNLDAATESLHALETLRSSGGTTLKSISTFETRYGGYGRLFLPGEVVTAVGNLGKSLGTLSENLTVVTTNATAPTTGINSNYLLLLDHDADVQEALENGKVLADMMEVFPTIPTEGGKPLNVTGIPEEAYTRLKEFYDNPTGYRGGLDTLLSYQDKVLAYGNQAFADMYVRFETIGDQIDALGLRIDGHGHDIAELQECLFASSVDACRSNPSIPEQFVEIKQRVTDVENQVAGIIGRNGTVETIEKDIELLRDYAQRFRAFLVMFGEGKFKKNRYNELVEIFLGDPIPDDTSTRRRVTEITEFASLPFGDEEVFEKSVKQFLDDHVTTADNKDEIGKVIDFRNPFVMGGSALVVGGMVYAGYRTIRDSREMKQALLVVEEKKKDDVSRYAGVVDPETMELTGGLPVLDSAVDEEAGTAGRLVRKAVSPQTLRLSHIARQVDLNTWEIIFPRGEGLNETAVRDLSALTVTEEERTLYVRTLENGLEEVKVPVSVHKVTTNGDITSANAADAFDEVYDAYLQLMMSGKAGPLFFVADPRYTETFPLAAETGASFVGKKGFKMAYLAGQWDIFDHPRERTKQGEDVVRAYTKTLKTVSGRRAIPLKPVIGEEKRDDLEVVESRGCIILSTGTGSRDKPTAEEMAGLEMGVGTSVQGSGDAKATGRETVKRNTYHIPVLSTAAGTLFRGMGAPKTASIHVSRRPGPDRLLLEHDTEVYRAEVTYLESDPFDFAENGKSARIQLPGYIQLDDILQRLERCGISYKASTQEGEKVKFDASKTSSRGSGSSEKISPALDDHVIDAPATKGGPDIAQGTEQRCITSLDIKTERYAVTDTVTCQKIAHHTLLTASEPTSRGQVVYTLHAPNTPEERLILRELFTRLYQAYKLQGGQKPSPEVLEELDIDQPHCLRKAANGAWRRVKDAGKCCVRRTKCCKSRTDVQFATNVGCYGVPPKTGYKATISDAVNLVKYASDKDLNPEVNRGWVGALRDGHYGRAHNKATALEAIRLLNPPTPTPDDTPRGGVVQQEAVHVLL